MFAALRREEGSITILVLGLFTMVVILILGGVDVTAAQLARMRLYDAADAISLDAADALDESGAYGRGLGDTVAISSATVQAASQESLGKRERPTGVTEWTIGPGTGSPDGQTAVVVLRGVAHLPITGPIFDALGGSVTITVESRAQSLLR